MNSRWFNVLLRLIAAWIDWIAMPLTALAMLGIAALSSMAFGEPTLGASGGSVPNAFIRATVFMLFVLPFLALYSVMESGTKRATFGKRVVGLEITDNSVGRLTFPKAFVRNLIKYMPWLALQIASMIQFAGLSASWSTPFHFLWFGGFAYWVISLIKSGETPYNRWMRCRVIQAPMADG